VQIDSASVPASGSNALRTSSKTNIHNGSAGSFSTTTNGMSSSGDSKSELRVSCASGISSNGNCSNLANGHVNGHGHSLLNGHTNSAVNGVTATLNGRQHSNEGNNNSSTLSLNSNHSMSNGQPATNGTLRVQCHKLPLLHTNNNS